MGALRTVLLWLDADPVRYWAVAWTAFGITVWLALRPAPRAPAPGAAPARDRTAWLFIAGIFATLVAFRWPVWFLPGTLNPDEAQMLAGAITLERFPVYWKFVDGTTHGPLCEYLLLLPSWLGAPLNYVTARVLAVALEAIALAGVWGVLRGLAPERVARIAVLPGLAFWSFVSWDDFVHYSTELPGVALLSLAAWAAAAAFAPPAPGRRPPLRWYLAGLCLGAVPFAKLQSAPQAAALAAAAATLWWLARRPDRAAVRRGLTCLVLGGITVPAIVLVFLLVYGLAGQFWYSYLAASLAYTGLGQHPLREMPGWFFNFAATSFAFVWFLAGALAFSLLYARAPSGRPPAVRAGIAVSLLLLGVSYLCVIQSGREVPHYLHLLVTPATALAGCVLAGAVAGAPDRLRSRPAPYVCFGLLALLPQIYERASSPHRFLGLLASPPVPAESAAARFIRERAGPDDTLATWGWEPSLYVATGLAQGTREAHTACELTTWPLQEFYLRRYVLDLRRRRPTWFVDAVGPGGFLYDDRRAFAHERTPEVDAIIARDYALLAEIGRWRIYRLRTPAGK